MPNPIISKQTIWSELWARAQREPLGVYCRFTDGVSARNKLQQTKPPMAHNYIIARTDDPTVVLIVGPNATVPNQEDRRQDLAAILSDITVPADDPSIAPLD